MLPYVFEANEAGVRKRTSKILPVCGVCGKRFVCVTTMKRHLVTHTGEKPFSCKVCGKQYTQKGNLRVHERTHRNDRPFECNICHQKFYRKEPMQKHQWRQHGIVHFKSRPLHPSSASSTSIDQTPLNSSVLEGNHSNDISFTSTQTSNVIVKTETHQYPDPSQDTPVLTLPSKYDGNLETPLQQISLTQQSNFPVNYPPPPDAHRSSSSNGRDRSLSPVSRSMSRDQFRDVRNQPVQLQPPQAHSNNGQISDLVENSNTRRKESLNVCVNLSSNTCHDSDKTSLSSVPKSSSSITMSSVPLDLNGEFRNAKQNILAHSDINIDGNSPNRIHISPSLYPHQPNESILESLPSGVSINMNQAPAFKSLANSKISSPSSAPNVHFTPSSSVNTITVTEHQPLQEKQTYSTNFGDISNKSNLIVILPQIPNPEQTPNRVDKQLNENNERCTETQQAPLKLKMKFAQAYQKEIQEQREKERIQGEEDSRQLGGSCSGVQQIIIKGIDRMELEDHLSNPSLPATRESSPSISVGIQDKIVESQQPKEMVECQCKSCGCTFVVHDPYNFRCDNCNMKYTSMPTHLIADPLQCIGCCQVFPHKPALKSHQMSPQITNAEGGVINTPTNDSKERPFRCCKCGYGFRQKAHLQKHQWRIHRRRIEPMDQQPIKEAEAFFQAIKSSKAISIKPSVSDPGATTSNDPDITTVTIQDIINHGVEHGIRTLRPFPGKNTTSSKYFSDVLGLEFEGSNSNISSNLEDIDSEGMDNNSNMEDTARYYNDDREEHNADMPDDSEEVINGKRPLDKEKYAENTQPLDLSPIKKGMAIDYSNTSKRENENFSFDGDAIKNGNSQSSTTHPPKITLRLRDFASSDIPTSHINYSQESNTVQFQPNPQQFREDLSNHLQASEKHNAVSRSLINTDQKIYNSSFVSSIQVKRREDNPLLNQRPLPTTQVSFVNALQTPINISGIVPTSSMAPLWKKARTSSPSRLGHGDNSGTGYQPSQIPVSVTSIASLKDINRGDTNVSTHRSLPPMTNLQKPMSLVRKLLPTATSLSISNSLSIPVSVSKLSATFSNGNVMENGSLNLQVGSHSMEQNPRNDLHTVSITRNQSSEVSAPFPNIGSKSGNSEFVRDKLFQFTDVRTV